MRKKVFYYKDELNDEFSTAKIEPRIIDENYKYNKTYCKNDKSSIKFKHFSYLKILFCTQNKCDN